MTLGDDHLRHHANNLTLVRLLLASGVIYSHCLWMITGSDRDLFATYMGVPISAYAVDGFFFVSGFLVYRSLLLKPDLARFAAARIVRLWPGLALMVVIVVLGGLFFTSLPTGTYLLSSALTFAARNLSLVHASYELPGIDCGEESCNVNGSLWTIPWEVRCYVVLGVLFLFRLHKEEWVSRFVLPITLIYSLVCNIPAVYQTLRDIHLSGAIYYVLQMQHLWLDFAFGMAAYIFRSRIPLRWRYLALLLPLNVLVNTLFPILGLQMRAILAGYTALLVAFLTVGQNHAFAATWPDLSYGMYIYAFPVMAALHLCGIDNLFTLFVLDVIITALFAAVSWFCIERPALNWLKARSRRPRQNQAA